MHCSWHWRGAYHEMGAFLALLTAHVDALNRARRPEGIHPPPFPHSVKAHAHILDVVVAEVQREGAAESRSSWHLLLMLTLLTLLTLLWRLRLRGREGHSYRLMNHDRGIF